MQVFCMLKFQDWVPGTWIPRMALSCLSELSTFIQLRTQPLSHPGTKKEVSVPSAVSLCCHSAPTPSRQGALLLPSSRFRSDASGAFSTSDLMVGPRLVLQVTYISCTLTLNIVLSCFHFSSIQVYHMQLFAFTSPEIRVTLQQFTWMFILLYTWWFTVKCVGSIKTKHSALQWYGSSLCVTWYVMACSDMQVLPLDVASSWFCSCELAPCLNVSET